jgi:23S rRNA pseudouridine1911/1915/1917 synthase
MPHIEFLADRREAGKTVSAVLRTRFGLTWSQAHRLVENGHVRVAGFACSDPALRIKNGNRVWLREGTVEVKGRQGEKKATAKKPLARVEKKPAPERAKPKESVPASALVYADDAVVVVNKPAGLTTSRSAEDAAEFGDRGQKFLPKTLADLVPGLIGTPGARVIPVHRLDRDTSGLVAFARTPAAAESLTAQFRKHTAERRYLALVRGSPADGRIESTVVADRGDGRRGTGPDGKRAVTRVKVRERFAGFALVECRLETGRTHQVRIHLGEVGTPLCGERVYDRPVNGSPAADGSGAKRPMLHAARLGFAHPDTGEAVCWEVPPPADFEKLLAKVRAAGGEAWEL